MAINPSIPDRIMSADGDTVLGSWNGESIHDLIRELDRIEDHADASYAGLPHKKNIPEDLRYQVETDYHIWACDKSGLCLVGETTTEVEAVDAIRAHYRKKYGGVEQFKEVLREAIEQRNKRLKMENP